MTPPALLWIVTRLKPLPLAIVVMTLLMLCKLAALVPGGPESSSVLETASRAVMPAAQAAAHEPAAPKAGEKPAAPKSAEPAAAPAAPAEAAPQNLVTAAPAVDPAAAEAERALLQDLRARRKQLDDRTAEMARREAMLAAAESRLSERVEQLAAMQTRLEALEQTRRERDEANWRGLVKTYETMRPRDAAAIFNELEKPILMQVLDRMKEAKAAPILAAMQPDRARAATSELAQWRTRLPGGSKG